MIDKNGKIFGKVSIIDVMVILAIIIASAGIYVRFFGGPSKTVVSSSKFYYTLKVENIRESNIDGLKKSINSNFYLNEKITGEMGRLIKVDVAPAVGFIEKANGEIVSANIPERFDAVLTFEMTGKVNESGYFSPSLEDISAGIEYKIKGKWSSVKGKVLSVWE